MRHESKGKYKFWLIFTCWHDEKKILLVLNLVLLYVCTYIPMYLSMIPKTFSSSIRPNIFWFFLPYLWLQILCTYIYVSTIVNFTDLLFKSQSCIENNYFLKIQVNKIINLQCSLKKNLNPLWVVHSIANDAKSSSFTVRLTYLYPEINNTEIYRLPKSSNEFAVLGHLGS